MSHDFEIVTEYGHRFRIIDDGYRVYARKLSENPINITDEDDHSCIFEYKHSAHPCADDIVAAILDLAIKAKP